MTKILATGATGNVGRELVTQLPPESVRAFSRQSGGDLSRPATLREPLADVDAVFLIWPFLSADAAPAVLQMIGGRRIVYLSSSGITEGHSDPINQLHGELEELIAQYTTDWTVLRSNTIASNARGWAGQIRAGDVVRGPDIPATAVVHERDLASVAARVLTSSQFIGERPVLTGPHVLSRAEQVEALGTVLGRELRFESMPMEVARAQLLADGQPAALVDALLASAGRGASELVSSTVEELTGSPARTFASWAEEHAGEFR